MCMTTEGQFQTCHTVLSLCFHRWLCSSQPGILHSYLCHCLQRGWLRQLGGPLLSRNGGFKENTTWFETPDTCIHVKKVLSSKSVVARGKNMHNKQMDLRRVSEMKRFPYRMRLPWEPEVDALTAADGAWVTASLQKMSHVALSHILTSAGWTNASNKLE